MKSVAILVLEGMEPFSVAAAYQIFSRVRSPQDELLYDVRLCGSRPAYKVGMFDIRVAHGLEDVPSPDLIIVPSVSDTSVEFGPELVDWLRAAAGRGTRIAAICTGAYVLAASGLLDGLRATVAWRRANELARRFPRINVDPNVLFVDTGQIVTAGPGVAATDMCLHVIRQDHGAAAAARIARDAAVPLKRDGAQAQLVVFHLRDASTRMGELLQWLVENLGRDLSIGAIAKQAGMSPRTLRRRFYEQTRTTPTQWLLDARIRRAQELLEMSRASVEDISREIGFRSSAVFRERFSEVVGMPPSEYRKTMVPVPAK